MKQVGLNVLDQTIQNNKRHKKSTEARADLRDREDA